MNKYEVVQAMAPMIRESLRTEPHASLPLRQPWLDVDGRHASDARRRSKRSSTGSKPALRAERALTRCRMPPNPRRNGRWASPISSLQVPAFDVPASGIVDYQDRSVPSPFTEGKWLKATAYANATPTVHHALAGWIPKVDPNGRGFSWNVALGGYGPGGAPNLTPENTGIYLPPGGSFAYQMHYTPVGKPVTDKTEVGYYFYKEEPKFILRQASITDFSLEIPAGEERHPETAYLEFPHDAQIFGVQPHCHSRCYSTKLRIRYPDGKETGAAEPAAL